MNMLKGNPVIVTILLVALIVGLGSSVVAWVNQAFFSLETQCEDVSLELETSCFNDDGLEFEFRNTGRDIQGFKIVALNEETNEFINETNMSTNDVYSETLAVSGDMAEIELIPRLREGEEEATCNNRALTTVAQECSQ